MNSKWIIDLYVKAKGTKLLGGKTSLNVCNFGLGSNFLAITPKTQAKRREIDK